MKSRYDYTIVTERGGEPVSAAQLSRFHQRYFWAGTYCHGKDVLEVACGTGPGLGYLNQVAKSLNAGDISPGTLAVARQHYGDRIDLRQFDAAATPFADASFDVVILFEAIYYLPDVERFVAETRRLLRPGGRLLLATANKDLVDFNPSPFSVRYLNPPELRDLLARHGFESEFFGGSPQQQEGLISGVLRLAKRLAVALHLMPRSMKGKRLLKRLVFGRLQPMPVEFDGTGVAYEPPVPIPASMPDHRHQVLYCVATKKSNP